MGKVVEMGDVYSIFEDPKHPYTQALMASVPRLGMERQRRLPAIRGMVPHSLARPSGCSFRTRCDHAIQRCCERAEPELKEAGASKVACFLH